MFRPYLVILIACTVSVEAAALAADGFQFTFTRSLFAIKTRESEHHYFEVFLSAQFEGPNL